MIHYYLAPSPCTPWLCLLFLPGNDFIYTLPGGKIASLRFATETAPARRRVAFFSHRVQSTEVTFDLKCSSDKKKKRRRKKCKWLTVTPPRPGCPCPAAPCPAPLLSDVPAVVIAAVIQAVCYAGWSKLCCCQASTRAPDLCLLYGTARYQQQGKCEIDNWLYNWQTKYYQPVNIS